MSFLMIENSVNTVPSIDMLCTLGASGSRGSVGQIGQFGSGFPYSIALFAREKLISEIKLCLGKEVYTFLTENVGNKLGTGEDFAMSKIVMKKQNGGKYPLNISTGFGEIDWTSVDMGIREFVSNALDGSMQSYGDYSHVDIRMVDDNQCRAKDGTIRMFIPADSDVRRYFDVLKTRFLMLGINYDPEQTIIPNYDNETRFYRKGVLVGTLPNKGLFHYNVPTLELKESRNLDKWSAIQAAGHAILLSNQTTIETFLRSHKAGDKNLETSIDAYYVCITDCAYKIREKAEKNKQTWMKAFKNVFGDVAISDDKRIIETVNKQGHLAVLVNEKLCSILTDKGVTKAESLLNNHEILGREISEPTNDVNKALLTLWNKLESHKLTNGKRIPKAKCFTQHMIGESQTLGFYEDGTVYIHEDISKDKGLMLEQTMLEEIAHYVTGSTDNSRDFQDYAFRVAATFMRANPTTSSAKQRIRDRGNITVTLNGNPATIAGWANDTATIIDTETMQSHNVIWEELEIDLDNGYADY